METDLLAELMAAKHRVLEQLHTLSCRQSDLIGDGDVTRLLGILSAKQLLLDQLQQLQPRLEPFRDQDPERRRWRSPEDRQRCQQVARRCEVLLEEIMAMERAGEAALVRRRDEVADRLQGAHSASQASRAYVQSSPPTTSRLDLTSES